MKLKGQGRGSYTGFLSEEVRPNYFFIFTWAGGGGGGRVFFQRVPVSTQD